MNKQLPRLPDSVRALRDDEEKRLAAQIPGLPKSRKDCPTCGAEQQFRWYEDYPTDLTVVNYDCPCADQIRLFKYFLHSGLGHSYQVASWGDVHNEVFEKNSEALHAIADYWQASRHYVARGFGLMLYGTHGTGKTLLASLLLKKLLTEGRGLNGYFTTFVNLLDHYAAGWGNNHEQAEWFNQRITYAEVLVIDDIGKEHAGRVTMSSNALDNVIRTRVQNDLPTIFTTNLSMAEFRQTYSTGTWGMLSEKVLPYEIDGSYALDGVASTTGYRELKLAKHKEELRNRIIRPIVWE